MATNYPTALDNGTNLPNPSGGAFQNNPDHGQQHSNANDAIKALEAKLGIGSTTPSSTGLLLIPTGPGTTAWSQLTSAQLAASITDETGSGSVVFANTPTLVTPKVDTINEATLNNGVTVGGVNLKSGLIATSAIPAASVTPSKLATGASSALVSTSETTTSTSYADLATTTDTVTVTIGANGIALVSIGAGVTNNISNALCIVTFAASGTNTIAAGVYEMFYQTYGTGSNHKAYSSFLITGLTPGSTTFKMKYLVNGGTGTFSVRRIAVVPL